MKARPLLCAKPINVCRLASAIFLAFAFQARNLRNYDDHQGESRSLFDLTRVPWELVCGSTWQRGYASLHNRISAHLSGTRYVISLAVEAGVADRLSGLVSEFIFALLSDRAFSYISYGDLPNWSVAFSSPFLHQEQLEFPSDAVESLKYTYKSVRNYRGDRSYAASVNMSAYYPIYLINEKLLASQFFELKDLAQEPAGFTDTTFIIMASNRGASYSIFNNPHHRQKLVEWGLTPETCFGCIMHFLFLPRHNICNSGCRASELQLHNAGKEGTLRIGIHVRLGDSVFRDDSSTSLDNASAFFECAFELVSQYKPARHLFFLISDSLQLRVLAKLKYKDVLVTDTSTKSLHVDCLHNPDMCRASNEAMQGAVANLFLMSMCDLHILTQGSGFSNMGAWLIPRNHSNHIFRILLNTRRVCSSPDAASDVVESWGAGV